MPRQKGQAQKGCPWRHIPALLRDSEPPIAPVLALFRVVPAPLSSAGVLGGHIPALLGAPCIPKKHLRLPSSTLPSTASGWLHALPTQQPYDLPAKERAPTTTSASGGHLYARIISTYIPNPTHGPCRLLCRRLGAAYELVLLHCCSASWVGTLWCVSVGGSVGL